VESSADIPRRQRTTRLGPTRLRAASIAEATETEATTWHVHQTDTRPAQDRETDRRTTSGEATAPSSRGSATQVDRIRAPPLRMSTTTLGALADCAPAFAQEACAPLSTILTELALAPGRICMSVALARSRGGGKKAVESHFKTFGIRAFDESARLQDGGAVKTLQSRSEHRAIVFPQQPLRHMDATAGVDAH